MKTILNSVLCGVLLMSCASPCFAMMGLDDVTPQKAKEMGVQVQFKGNGPQGVVELKFKVEGKLKDFRQVRLEIYDGDKVLVGDAELREKRSDSNEASVTFFADRAYLDKIQLWIVGGEPGSFVGHVIRVKDFVGAQPAPTH